MSARLCAATLQAQQSVAVDREGQAVSTRNLTLKASCEEGRCGVVRGFILKLELLLQLVNAGACR